MCVYIRLYEIRGLLQASPSELIILFSSHRIGLQMRVWRGSFKLYNLTVYFMTDKMLSSKKLRSGVRLTFVFYFKYNYIHDDFSSLQNFPLEVMQSLNLLEFSSFKFLFLLKISPISLERKPTEKNLKLKFSPLCLFKKIKKIKEKYYMTNEK